MLIYLEIPLFSRRAGSSQRTRGKSTTKPEWSLPCRHQVELSDPTVPPCHVRTRMAFSLSSSKQRAKERCVSLLACSRVPRGHRGSLQLWEGLQTFKAPQDGLQWLSRLLRETAVPHPASRYIRHEAVWGQEVSLAH